MGEHNHPTHSNTSYLASMLRDGGDMDSMDRSLLDCDMYAERVSQMACSLAAPRSACKSVPDGGSVEGGIPRCKASPHPSARQPGEQGGTRDTLVTFTTSVSNTLVASPCKEMAEDGGELVPSSTLHNCACVLLERVL